MRTERGGGEEVEAEEDIGVNPGELGVETPRFLAGVVGSQWSRGRVAKYYYILSCTGSMFESGDF